MTNSDMNFTRRQALAGLGGVSTPALVPGCANMGSVSGQMPAPVAQAAADTVLDEIRESTRKLAAALDVRGIMNVQYAVKDRKVYLIEVNPRASRTIPFVSKATGVQLARAGARVCGQ